MLSRYVQRKNEEHSWIFLTNTIYVSRLFILLGVYLRESTDQPVLNEIGDVEAKNNSS